MSVLNDPAKAYETFLGKFLAENPTVQPIASTDPAEIGEFIVKNAPAGTARKWLAELIALSGPSAGRLRIGVLMLSAAGVITGASLIYGIFFTPEFLPSLAVAENARGLITFLFAFATIAVVLITAIATFWVNPDEVEKRGTMAKEVLTILIGIMGTILGFYFGSADNVPALVAPEASEMAIQ
jgi:hypothetical protein